MPIRLPWRPCLALAVLIGLAQPSYGADPIAVVVLPPQATVALDAAQTTAAELLCDQLATKLAEDRSLHVVDRTQIEKVLAERALAGSQTPVLAYDAMLRLRLDPVATPPTLKLEILALSTGNIVGVTEWPWKRQSPTEHVQDMAKACRDPIIKAPLAAQGRIKVRLLGVAASEGMGRLEPLQLQLEAMLEQTVQRCSTACVVSHLEASSTKEESLLLLLGQARLGAGREFSPQADVLLETQLSEEAAQGKTFEDTIIDIRFRMNRQATTGQWSHIKGRAGDWAKLAPQSCELLAKALGETRSQQASELATDMIVRRAQAEAELQASLKQKNTEGYANLQRVAAAAKLDPTYEPAAFRLVMSICHQYPLADPLNPLQEALSYLERFPSDMTNRRSVIGSAYWSVLERLRIDGHTNAQETQILRQIVEIALNGGIDGYDPFCVQIIDVVHKGMLAANVGAASRLAWLDKIRDRISILEPDSSKIESFHRDEIRSSFLRIRALLVTIAVGTGQPELGRQRLREFMAHGRWVSLDQQEVAPHLRDTIVAMKDEKILHDYDQWLKALATPVHPIELTWHDYAVYERTSDLPKSQSFPPMLPLARSPTALYGVDGTTHRALLGWMDVIPARQQLWSVPIDEKGSPTGPASVIKWPTVEADIALTAAVYQDGHLYLGTKRTGLLILNVATGKWRQIGITQGLPDTNVFLVHALDDKSLVLVVGQPHKQRDEYCTLEIKTDKITLLHQTDGSWPPALMWPSGEHLMACNNYGLAADILHQPPKFTPWPKGWPYGWTCRPDTLTNEPTSLATLAGKHYVMSTTGLHEIEASGRELCHWWNNACIYADGQDHVNLSESDITVPGDLPNEQPDDRYTYVTQTSDHLFLVGRDGETLAYQPASDKWYGPYHFPRMGDYAYPMGVPAGVWFGGSDAMIFVAAADFLDTAKAAGRVMTSPEVRQRKNKLAAQTGPLDAAKYDLLHHDFPTALRKTQAILDAHPDDPQALLLMAVLHDFWCLNKPEDALLWYGKLAAMEGNPAAIYAGLHAIFRIQFTLGRWKQAVATGELLMDKVPRHYAGGTNDIERFTDYARDEAARAATQPGDKR